VDEKVCAVTHVATINKSEQNKNKMKNEKKLALSCCLFSWKKKKSANFKVRAVTHVTAINKMKNENKLSFRAARCI